MRGGARTRILQPGEAQRLDLGVIASGVPELYCTLAGHRAAGMTLDIEVRENAGPRVDLGEARS